MTNEEAIAELRDIETDDPEIREAYALAIAALSRDRWISVEDRLPEEGEWVLIFGPGYHVPLEGFLISGAWIDDQFERRTVTHWMPLPEPPKEDKT